MNWELVRFICAALLIVIGLFVTITGVLGFYKFKFILNRMHAAALIDTLGLFFIVLGCIVAKGFVAETCLCCCIFMVNFSSFFSYYFKIDLYDRF